MQGLIAKPGMFRIILALAVVVSHVTGLEIGRLAVMMFFYLSGYWVADLWSKRFAPDQTLSFYGSRFFRIFPLYIICAIAAAAFTTANMQPTSWTLLGVASSTGAPLSVEWSLDVELQFYLLVPAIVWLLAKPWRFSQIALVGAVTIGGWLVYEQLGVVTVAQYAPAFVLGVLTMTYAWRPSARLAYVSLAAFVAVTALAYFHPATSSFLLKAAPDPFDRDIFSMIWMLPLLPYIAASLQIRSDPLDRHFGNLSYPIYLVHAPVIAEIRHALGDGMGPKLLSIIVALALSFAVYWLIDRRVEPIRQRMFDRRRDVPQTA